MFGGKAERYRPFEQMAGPQQIRDNITKNLKLYIENCYHKFLILSYVVCWLTKIMG